MPPLTDIMQSVDELGAWAAGGPGRIPADSEASGYGNMLRANMAPAGAGVLLATTVAATSGTAFTLTAGDTLVPSGDPSDPYFGYDDGTFFSGQLLGALSPSLFEGVTIAEMFVQNAGNAGDHFRVVMLSEVAQDFFSSVTVNSVTYNTNDLSLFVAAGGQTIWKWNKSVYGLPFTSAGSYAGTLTP